MFDSYIPKHRAINNGNDSDENKGMYDGIILLISVKGGYFMG